MMKNLLLSLTLLCFISFMNAQNPGEIYFNYDELIGIEILENNKLEVHYNLKGKQDFQVTDFNTIESGIKLGNLNYNANPNVKKLSGEPLEFKDGNLYLAKYRMFFYSDKNRKNMESQDCYIINNEIFYAPKGKVKGKLKKAIQNLQKASLQTLNLDSKTTYDKHGIHCLGATEILGIPKK